MKDKDYQDAWCNWEHERNRKKIKSSLRARNTRTIHISDALDNWKKSIDNDLNATQAELSFRWEEIVGKTISPYAFPVEIQNGKLILRVKDGIWRHQLLFLRDEIILKINGSLGKDTVREIVLTG